MKKFPWLTFAIIAASITIHLLQLDGFFQWSRGEGFSLDQFWMLASSHLAHWSTSHLIWNALMFAMLGSLIEVRSRKAMVRALMLSALLIIPAVAYFMPEVTAYRGLSGVASALFLLLACMIWKQQAGPLMKIIAVLAITSLLGKCAYELIYENAAFAQLGETIIACPQAHLAGALAGLLSFRVSGRRQSVHERIIIPASQGA
jgi:rhomboid family GlyGly-CTERM serine protease